MAEYQLFLDGLDPYVSTFEFHEHRERAPHLEQSNHRERLDVARELIVDAANILCNEGWKQVAVSDLGCGDGGLLQLLRNEWRVQSWGYDFQPSNAAGWAQRGIRAESLDVFNGDKPVNELVVFGDVVVMTEVLEHLQDPHAVVAYLAELGKSALCRPSYLVASSPFTETYESHDECHAWAWDIPGYAKLLTDAGWKVLQHRSAGGMFQVVQATIR
jgi:hypothetical protein